MATTVETLRTLLGTSTPAPPKQTYATPFVYTEPPQHKPKLKLHFSGRTSVEPRPVPQHEYRVLFKAWGSAYVTAADPDDAAEQAKAMGIEWDLHDAEHYDWDVTESNTNQEEIEAWDNKYDGAYDPDTGDPVCQFCGLVEEDCDCDVCEICTDALVGDCNCCEDCGKTEDNCACGVP